MTNPKAWRCFIDLCLGAEDDKMVTELFQLLLTPEEKISIESRCLIIKALLENKEPQRKMSENIGVSIAKITRGSNELKRISPKLKKYLQDKLVS
jgi:TrpR family trp operon transcriptional repressor